MFQRSARLTAIGASIFGKPYRQQRTVELLVHRPGIAEERAAALDGSLCSALRASALGPARMKS